jgi:hypothetical protein
VSKARVRLVPSEGWYSASLRGVSGAFSQGKTRQSATRNIMDAVRCLAVALCEGVERGTLALDLRQARAILRHGQLSPRLRRRLESVADTRTSAPPKKGLE